MISCTLNRSFTLLLVLLASFFFVCHLDEIKETTEEAVVPSTPPPVQEEGDLVNQCPNPKAKKVCRIAGTTEYMKTSVSIDSQRDIDDNGLVGCRVIDGSLRFDGGKSKKLDLSQFEELTEITGQLVLTNLKDVKLKGFHKLQKVQKLSIVENLNLTDISALSSLTEVLDLHLENNPVLKSIDNFKNLRSLRLFSLVNNYQITDLSALSGIKNISNLQLSGNMKLRSLKGLWMNNTVGNVLIIESHSLVNLEALEVVEKVTATLRIENNSNLKNLNGLKVKDLTGGFLYVLKNRRLENMTALSSLEHNPRLAVISSNPLLDCTPYTSYKLFPIKGSVDNKVNCPTIMSEANRLRELNQKKIDEEREAELQREHEAMLKEGLLETESEDQL